jgi:hypothetical protein
LIDPVIFNEVVNALALSDRGYYWRQGLRKMRQRCESDPDIGAPLDPVMHAHATRAFVEEIAGRCEAFERPFVAACILELAFIDYAFHRNRHAQWGIA